MNILPVVSAAALSAAAVFADPVHHNIPRETDAHRAERLAWWQADRFGMFIHFGRYSMAGRHEWVKE